MLRGTCILKHTSWCVLFLVYCVHAQLPTIGGLYPGVDGFSPPRWAGAALNKGLDTPVVIGEVLGDISTSQMRKNGKNIVAAGVGILATRFEHSSLRNLIE